MSVTFGFICSIKVDLKYTTHFIKSRYLIFHGPYRPSIPGPSHPTYLTHKSLLIHPLRGTQEGGQRRRTDVPLRHGQEGGTSTTEGNRGYYEQRTPKRRLIRPIILGQERFLKNRWILGFIVPKSSRKEQGKVRGRLPQLQSTTTKTLNIDNTLRNDLRFRSMGWQLTYREGSTRCLRHLTFIGLENEWGVLTRSRIQETQFPIVVGVGSSVVRKK